MVKLNTRAVVRHIYRGLTASRFAAHCLALLSLAVVPPSLAQNNYAPIPRLDQSSPYAPQTALGVRNLGFTPNDNAADIPSTIAPPKRDRNTPYAPSSAAVLNPIPDIPHTNAPLPDLPDMHANATAPATSSGAAMRYDPDFNKAAPESETYRPAGIDGAEKAQDKPSDYPVCMKPKAGDHYEDNDVMGAAEGVFGKGAKGLGDVVQHILAKEGKPNAWIAGSEASAALIVGLRYGKGLMCHNVEGARKVYWTGPSLGLDTGGDVTKTFILVYNLYDSQDLYKRYAQVEGRAYYIGGFSISVLKKGNVLLVPVRLGVGLRLGVNVGYMKFREKAKVIPF